MSDIAGPAGSPPSSEDSQTPGSPAGKKGPVHADLVASLDAAIRFSSANTASSVNQAKPDSEIPDEPAEAEDASAGTSSGPGQSEKSASQPSSDDLVQKNPDAVTPAAGQDSGPDDLDEEEQEYEDEEDEGDEEEALGQMSLRDHLKELRKRVLWAFLFSVGGFLVCYPFAEEIFKQLTIPLVRVMPPGSTMIFTSIPETFFTYLKLSFLSGMFLASPLIFYQVWSFIAPGLYKEERVFVIPVAVMSAVCFVGGGSFCFFVVFPIAFDFFMSYSREPIQAMPSVREYLSFVLQLIFAFGLVFELPLFVFFLSRLGLVTAAKLRAFRRYAILIIFILAAVLTPPDVISQLLMAGPMLLLYEFSIYIAAVFGKKSPGKDESVEPGEDVPDKTEDQTSSRTVDQ